MKGKLIKTSRGWEVEYNENVGCASDGRKNHYAMFQTKAELLHPDSTFIEYPGHSFVGKEVEFEIVNYGFAGKYAKLINKNKENMFPSESDFAYGAPCRKCGSDPFNCECSSKKKEKKKSLFDKLKKIHKDLEVLGIDESGEAVLVLKDTRITMIFTSEFKKNSETWNYMVDFEEQNKKK